MTTASVDDPEIVTLSDNILISPISCVALGLLKGLSPAGTTWAELATSAGNTDADAADALQAELWARDLVRQDEAGAIYASDALMANGAIPQFT